MDRLPLFPAGPPPSALDAAGPLRRNPSCNRCQFGDRAIKRCLPPVSVGGAGGLLVVGSFPDRVANVSGQGFSDHAGRYTVEAVGKAWKGPAAFTYAVNCHPGEPTGGGAAPEEKHVVKCRPYVRSYAEQVAPTRILLLGELACWAVLGRSVSTRSVRRGFAWVQLPHGRVPALILMNPAVLDGRFARAAWESDLQWACSTPDSFFEERFQLIAEATYSVVRTAEEGAEAIDDLTRAALAVSRGLAWDVESRGKLHDPDFRIISAAIGLEGENHSYVWDRRALETPEVQAHLVGAIRDPRLLFIEQGSYDERASLCYFDTPIAGDRHDVRLLRKMLDCAVPKADLDTMSEMVGFGGYKDEFGAELAAVKDRVKKWNPRQTLLFDDCPDPEARLRLWEIYQSKDPKLVDDYEDSYRYALVPTAKLSIYNARDQVATGLLHRLFWPQVRADDGLSLLWDEVTGPASRSYTWGEHWGAPISRTAIEAVIHYSNLTKAQIEPQLRAHLTPTFKNLNLASVEQVSAFLYTPAALGGLGLPVPKKTKKGANSLDDEALEELENRTKHPFVSLFRAFVSSDTDRKKAEEFRRFLRADGCMHPSYLLDGTKTGRPSCHAPNLYNLKSPEDCEECNGKGCAACDGTGTDEESRRIRSCIEAPDDFVILEADESQVELRGMAMFCREEVLIEAYVNRRDIHQETIDFVFEVCGVRIVRRFAKVGNFMIPYGGTDFSFGARLKLPPEEAKIIYGSIVNRYPRVNAKKRQMLAEAQHTGCSYNLWFRDGQEVVCQKRPLWDLDSRDGSRKRKAENGLLNTAIQGTYSGSLILASHARLVEYILRNNLQHLWRPSVNVYDSIIGPVHKALLPLAARLTVDVMTSWVIGRLPDGRPFPLEADCKMGKSLGVAKKYKPPATVREAVEECKKLGLQELLKKPEQTNRIAGSRWGL